MTNPGSPRLPNDLEVRDAYATVCAPFLYMCLFLFVAVSNNDLV